MVKKAYPLGFQPTDALFRDRFVQPVDPGPAGMPQHGHADKRGGEHQEECLWQADNRGYRNKGDNLGRQQRRYRQKEPLNHYCYSTLHKALLACSRRSSNVLLAHTLFAPPNWRRA